MSAVSVFLAPHDEAFGDRIAGALARQGKETRLIAGEQADLFIDNGRDVEASIVIWSEATQRLARLHQQARDALERGALIPVSADGGPPPEGFENLPPIDLSAWRGDDDDPRWRFVLEALAIAAEYSQPAEPAVAPMASATPAPTEPELAALEPETPAPVAPAVATSTELAPVDLTPKYSPAVLPPQIADGEIRNIPTITQLLALLPFPTKRKKPKRSSAAAKQRRFDPNAVAVVGVMLLCLLTGAAIILGPSLLSPAPPESSASETPAAAPAPEEPRIELAAAGPLIEFEDEPTAAPNAAEPEESLYDPYIEDMEGFGEGDISYPEGFADGEFVTDSAADELHLALLGPAAPGEIVPPAPSLSVKEAVASGAPRTPTLKPAPPNAAPATLGALLAEVPELVNPEAEHFSDCADCPDMVVISAGAFQMGPVAGDRARPNEGPSTRIALDKAFAIAAREVTFAEWDACVADGGCAGHKAEDFRWGRGDQPVVDVSFNDAQNYAGWLSQKTGETYRLPSEAEWEYAARAGRSTPFSFGEELSSRNANYDGRFAYRGKKGRWIGRPTPASRYPANAFGLFDMHGNVWEWTADCWRKSLAGLPTDGRPRGGACANRVLKGGAFNTGGWRLRAAHRIGKPASAREMEIGFRVVRDL